MLHQGSSFVDPFPLWIKLMDANENSPNCIQEKTEHETIDFGSHSGGFVCDLDISFSAGEGEHERLPYPGLWV
jgi:hypothetical protein